MRIVTRPDFDGVVCAVLLFDAETIIHPVKWVEPSEIQKGQIEICEGDILANLPYDDRCFMWFDHHCTNKVDKPFKGAYKIAPSAAGIIHEYYAGRFSRDFTELVIQTDKIDSANLTLDEVLHPEKYPYILLSMTILNREKQDEPYWNNLIYLIGRYDIHRVLEEPVIKSRCEKAIENNKIYKEFLKKHTRIQDHVAITDFRKFETPPEGNRFLIYSMFQEASVHVKIRFADKERKTVAVSVGHSIFNNNCRVNAGKLLSGFEGGGHRGAASCRFNVGKANEYIPKIIEALIKNEPNENQNNPDFPIEPRLSPSPFR
jgi:oligoribonuclease NrnB/cAMP/cGMP phosphodiesterase (DHH superfamily)